jgi:hypothetical protein
MRTTEFGGLQQNCSPSSASRRVVFTPKPSDVTSVSRVLSRHPPVPSRVVQRSASMKPTLRITKAIETPTFTPSRALIPASASRLASDRKVSAFSGADSTATNRRASYTIVKPFHLATDERAKVHARADTEVGSDSLPVAAAAVKIEALLQTASVTQAAASSTSHASFKAKALAAFRAKGSFAPPHKVVDVARDTVSVRSAVPAPTVPHSPALATKLRSHQRSESVTRQGSARSASAVRS